jgi:hypothetical protein
VFLRAVSAVHKGGASRERTTTTKRIDEPKEWTGRELLDANAKSIGTIAGLGYPRRKFGTAWLLVETGAMKKVLVPVDQIDSLRGRLVLPYPKTFIESGPALEVGGSLSKAEERRLCLHYGLDSALPDSGCRQGCGLCQVRNRAKAASRPRR